MAREKKKYNNWSWNGWLSEILFFSSSSCSLKDNLNDGKGLFLVHETILATTTVKAKREKTLLLCETPTTVFILNIWRWFSSDGKKCRKNYLNLMFSSLSLLNVVITFSKYFLFSLYDWMSHEVAVRIANFLNIIL